jgi:hypothetical protein
MAIKLALALAMLSVAMHTSAATVVDTAPAKKKAQAVQAREEAKRNASDGFAEYVQWHRESGFAIYASPLEAVAPDAAPDSCAKANTPALN